mgnify:CR=1 FL=1
MKKPIDDVTQSMIMNYALDLIRINHKYSFAEAVKQVQKALEELNK